MTESTTLRVPTTLRDLIARLASERDSTMLDVVTDAVELFAREQWWERVHESIDGWSDDDIEKYQQAAAKVVGTLADGLT